MTETEYATIDEYIALFPPEQREIMQKVRETIRGAAPEAAEKISYQMPAFWHHRNIAHFAAQKNHLGFYPGADGVASFTEELAPYETSKGTVRFPWDRPVPYALIGKIVRHNARAAEREAAEKAAKKK